MAPKRKIRVNWNYPQEIMDYIRLLARKEENRMRDIGLGGNYDTDDLTQELFISVARQWKTFNPARAGWKTFIDQIAFGRFGHLEEYLTRQRRDVRLTSSLFKSWPGDDDDESIISDHFNFSDTPDADLFGARQDSLGDADFRIWLDTVCEKKLDPGLSQLVRWFMEDGTIPELANKTWVSEQTWYSRRNALKKIFKKYSAHS